MEAEADFSRRELQSFLQELAGQVETGRVEVQIPGKSTGKISVVPKQPIDIVFKHDEEEGKMSIEIDFEERRRIESQ